MSKPTTVKGEKVAEVVKDPKLLAAINERMDAFGVVDSKWLKGLIGSEKVAQLVNQNPEVLTVNYDVELAARHMKAHQKHEDAVIKRYIELGADPFVAYKKPKESKE